MHREDHFEYFFKIKVTFSVQSTLVLRLDCRKEDITIIDSPVGLPGRAIRGEFIRRVSSGVKETFKCSWKCLRTCNVKTAPYCIAIALANAKKGILEEGFAFAGSNAYRVNKIVSVKELIATLAGEYMAATTQKSTLEHQIQSMPPTRSFTASMCSFRRGTTEAVCCSA